MESILTFARSITWRRRGGYLRSSERMTSNWNNTEGIWGSRKGSISSEESSSSHLSVSDRITVGTRMELSGPLCLTLFERRRGDQVGRPSE